MQQDPAEFVRLAVALASKEASAILADGSKLERPFESHLQDYSGRATASRLLQSGLMEFCNGPLNTYDNRTDSNNFLGRRRGAPGITNKGLDRGFDAIFGENYKSKEYRNLPFARVRMKTRFQAALKKTPGVAVGMRWAKEGSHSRHKVVLERFEDGKAILWNPQGKAAEDNAHNQPPGEFLEKPGCYAMSEKEFFSRLLSFNLPPQSR